MKKRLFTRDMIFRFRFFSFGFSTVSRTPSAFGLSFTSLFISSLRKLLNLRLSNAMLVFLSLFHFLLHFTLLFFLFTRAWYFFWPVDCCPTPSRKLNHFQKDRFGNIVVIEMLFKCPKRINKTRHSMCSRRSTVFPLVLDGNTDNDRHWRVK